MSKQHPAPIVCFTTVRSRAGSVDDVVGTLDIHVGARLPSEVLEGSLPPVRPCAPCRKEHS